MYSKGKLLINEKEIHSNVESCHHTGHYKSILTDLGMKFHGKRLDIGLAA